ncbi:ABC transporter substrate-binding protein [Streptomyces sp. UNOC14_S4]|uniref:ABC transporter substrate-binding protein n=1 Tax=Streptomyces sp. UNOC14_S4 TaxID=2872340 RepID=UPI001E2ACAA9|nr:ABC transporter substrate-binding protein [Streptomyces sp. UNOC14_S4]MCC3771621.1 ABC transporter substrate-binding protein [Streptomyces sp. UNOC14_S4]
MTHGPDALPPWWKGWRGIGVLALVVALVAGGTVWLLRPSDEDHRCASGTPDLQWTGSGADRECVGLMDETAYPFDPKLKDITERIAAENRRVRDQFEKPAEGRTPVPYVKIAVLTPLTESDTSALPIEEIRSGLEGAFTAQCRANACPALSVAAATGVQGRTPQIQLVLASEGRNQTYWPTVVDRLAGLTDGPHPLVAVAGMGVSIPETQSAADELGKRRIPSIGAVLTATDIASERLFKVSPSNTDYAKALRRRLERLPADQRRGYLVFDSRDDNFVRTMRKAYDDVFADFIDKRRVSFVGTTGRHPEGVPRLFFNALNNICLTKAQLVFYAGRGRDLSDLVRALSTRGQCGHDKPITIVTGSTGAVQQAQEVMKLLKGSDITIQEASATDSEGWIRGVQAPEGFPAFHRSFGDLKFSDQELTDGYAIMNHDAVLTAVWATRIVTGQTGRETPDVQDVFHQITNLHDAGTVPAASGKLSFDDASQGWPHNKPVPIIQVPAGSGTQEPPYYTP